MARARTAPGWVIAGLWLAPALGRAAPWGFLTNLPADLGSFAQVTFSRSAVIPMAVVTAETTLLLAYDGPLYDQTVKLGTQLGIPQQDQQTEIGTVHLPVVNVDAGILTIPDNLGAAFYFLGNGWFYGGVIAAFLAEGVAASDRGALETGADIFEAITADGILVQALKMSTGREDLNNRTIPSGRWRWPTAPSTYLAHVDKYDAFPSGHLATGVCATEVIAMRYPEAWWIRPVGYALIVPLAFQMVNSGVHWYSDYPLAIYMGYTLAEIVVGRRGPLANTGGTWQPEVSPLTAAGGAGLTVSCRF